jgi:hypothetical protein
VIELERDCVIEAATRISFLARKSLSISLDPEMDILAGDPLTVLIHYASLEHRGCALPMQIDPARYSGLGHAIAPANVFGHLSCEGFDIRDHG